jgi:methionine-gamma-lyase
MEFKPDILYMETSSNPINVITNLRVLSTAAREANKGVISIVDNTFATPLLVNPLVLGADVVLHSLTKYINGHGDILGGIIISNNAEYMAHVRKAVIDFGTCMPPFDAWLTLRGLRTLAARLDKISSTALAVAKYLSAHPLVKRTRYPGLPSHPQYSTVQQIICRPLSEYEIEHGFPFSGMIAFDIASSVDTFDAARTFLDSLKLVRNQVSLGDIKTLASCPGLSTQTQVTVEDCLRTGVSSATIRISIGMESVKDICADINQALHIAVRPVEVDAVGLMTSGLNLLSTESVSDGPQLKSPVEVASVPSRKNESAPVSSLDVNLARLRSLCDEMSRINKEISAVQDLIRADTIEISNK